MDNKNICLKVKKLYNASLDAFADSVEKSEECMRYANNDSWTASAIVYNDKFKKPSLKYNIIIPIIHTLKGNEELSRRKAIIKPTSLKDVGVVDIIQQRWNAIIDEQDVESKLQSAWIHALVMPIGGYLERNFVLNKEGYLDFQYRIANPFHIHLDPETTTSNLSDCRWLVKESWYPLDIIKDKYQIKKELIKNELQQGWWEKISSFFKRITDSEYSSNSYYDKANDRFQVLELWERETTPMYKIFDNGEYNQIQISEYSKYKKANVDAQIIRPIDEDRMKITTIIPYFEDAVVYEEYSKCPVANFDVFPVFALNFDIQRSETTSLVEMLLDPQNDMNMSMSQRRDFWTQAIAGALFVNKGNDSEELIKNLKLKGNQAGQVYEVRNIEKNMPRRLLPESMNPESISASGTAIPLIEAISGVNEAMKGAEGKSSESGVLREQKIVRAAAAINDYFKNLAICRKLVVKDFVDCFGWVYSELDRPVNVKDEQKNFTENIVNLQIAGDIVNNVSNLSLEVELDEGENNITTKEENFNKMIALSNLIAQINPALVDVRSLVELAPIPRKDKMLAYIDSVMKAQSEQASQTAELEKTKQILENLKIETGMINEEEKLKIEAEKINGQIQTKESKNAS